ncbi:protein of unknown function [Cupriavidus taiwanensis]|nr:protein of unknown function [Cupriavidus taiwanensis]
MPPAPARRRRPAPSGQDDDRLRQRGPTLRAHRSWRPSLLHHVGALGHREPERIGRQRRVFLHAGEGQQRGVAERVAQFHGFEIAGLEADADALELRVLGLGRQLQPFHAVARRPVPDHEVLVEVVAAEQDRRRAGTQRAVELALGDLVQVLVIDVQGLAVGLQQLLVGLGIAPGELARTREHEGAAGGAGHLDVGALPLDLALREFAARALHAGDEALQLVGGGGMGRRLHGEHRQRGAGRHEDAVAHDLDPGCYRMRCHGAAPAQAARCMVNVWLEQATGAGFRAAGNRILRQMVRELRRFGHENSQFAVNGESGEIRIETKHILTCRGRQCQACT